MTYESFIKSMQMSSNNGATLYVVESIMCISSRFSFEIFLCLHIFQPWEDLRLYHGAFKWILFVPVSLTKSRFSCPISSRILLSAPTTRMTRSYASNDIVGWIFLKDRCMKLKPIFLTCNLLLFDPKCRKRLFFIRKDWYIKYHLFIWLFSMTWRFQEII